MPSSNSAEQVGWQSRCSLCRRSGVVTLPEPVPVSLTVSLNSGRGRDFFVFQRPERRHVKGRMTVVGVVEGDVEVTVGGVEFMAGRRRRLSRSGSRSWIAQALSTAAPVEPDQTFGEAAEFGDEAAGDGLVLARGFSRRRTRSRGHWPGRRPRRGCRSLCRPRRQWCRSAPGFLLPGGVDHVDPIRVGADVDVAVGAVHRNRLAKSTRGQAWANSALSRVEPLAAESYSRVIEPAVTKRWSLPDAGPGLTAIPFRDLFPPGNSRPLVTSVSRVGGAGHRRAGSSGCSRQPLLRLSST